MPRRFHCQKRAVEIDPNFAIAHAHSRPELQRHLERIALATASIRKAVRVAEPDEAITQKFYIEFAVHYRDVTGNLESARETLLLWARTYPRDLTGDRSARWIQHERDREI